MAHKGGQYVYVTSHCIPRTCHSAWHIVGLWNTFAQWIDKCQRTESSPWCLIRKLCVPWSPECNNNFLFGWPFTVQGWVGSQPWEIPVVKSETGPICRGQGVIEERGAHPRLMSGEFNKRGNLQTKLVLGSTRWVDFCPPPIRILKVYKQALMGFCHIPSPEGLNGTLPSQGCILETSPSVGMVGGTYVPRTGEGVRNLWLPVSSSRVNQQHILSMTSSNSLAHILFRSANLRLWVHWGRKYHQILQDGEAGSLGLRKLLLEFRFSACRLKDLDYNCTLNGWPHKLL